jgi:predicted alpha-1,6-mannanase (GH76 family)
MPLFGMPDIKNIDYVEITDTHIGEETKKITSEKDIKTARNLAGVLRYKFKTVNDNEPFIIMVFHIKDGKTAKLSVGEKTALWKDKKYSIKDTDFFIKAVEGLYFISEKYE